LALAGLCTSFTVLPTDVPVYGDRHDEVLTLSKKFISNISKDEEAAEAIYAEIGLQQYGLSKQAFNYAFKGYSRLVEQNRISNNEWLTICDFSQSSRNKRLYLVDLTNHKLVMNTYVAHGRNSGGEYASSFSNRPESLKSSLGFYLTQSTYIGGHGLSLKICGLEKGFNDNACSRNIVIHGAAYIENGWLNHSSYMGRSYGCPAVPLSDINTLISIIKNGTCLFIYHPQRDYLLGSKLLNG